MRSVLITGAAGYVGGSILEDLVTRLDPKDATIIAAVRSQAHVDGYRQAGVNAVLLDLHNEAEVAELVVDSKVSIVIHTASSFDASMATPLIKALGERARQGEDVYFVHASIAAMYSPEGGWPYGKIEDTDSNIIEKQKACPNLIRETDVTIAELATAQGVKLINLVLPTIYGTGTGRFRRLSAKLPPIIKDAIDTGIVHRYHKDAIETVTHIADVVVMYSIIVEHILHGLPLPLGYYFVIGHTLHWWNFLDQLAASLHKKGLAQSQVEVWESDEVAAAQLGLPAAFISTMLCNNPVMVPVNPFKVGWKPEWTEERLLSAVDAEVEDAMRLGAKSTSSLFAAERE